jgi:uncharacterized protein YgbK (DUF1537 family)
VSVIAAASLLASLPDEQTGGDAKAQIRASLERSKTKIVVIDDDPTGSQSVADVPVIVRWDVEDIDWALRDPASLSVLLTNSRSLTEASAVAINHEIGRRLAERGLVHGLDIRCISRSDSTLRGHFPAEVDALAQGLREGGQAVDGILLCPAFIDAGRITVEDVHYVATDAGYQPVAETEFARDHTFGYIHSRLSDWAAERGIDRARIRSVDLAMLRAQGPGYVEAVLGQCPAQLTIANAACEADLDQLVLGLGAGEADGARIIYRTGPSFVRARSGAVMSAPLTRTQIAPHEGPGLIVVGSHTNLTSEQLRRARESHQLQVVEMRTDRAIAGNEEIDWCVDELTAALAIGDTALITSRTVLAGRDAAESLDIARRVAAALVAVVQAIPDEQPVGWVVAKGGITSSDIATRALGARRARVLGQIFPGLVSVWRLDATSRRPGVPYIVFPGNVGTPDALTETINRITS